MLQIDFLNIDIGISMFKHQGPNPKLQTNSNHQMIQTKHPEKETFGFGVLVIVIFELFVIWDL
jgi:hypothetical protein